MIVSFPSPLWFFEVEKPIAKGTPTDVFHLVGIASLITITAPIDLKPMDRIMVDTRDGSVQMIQRGFITIWHWAWNN